MKKKYLAAVLCIALGLAACGSTESNVQDMTEVSAEPLVQPQDIEKTKNQEEAPETTENQGEEETPTETQIDQEEEVETPVEENVGNVEEQAQADKAAYEAFFSGEESLYFDNYNLYVDSENGYEIFFTEGLPYTFKEFLEHLMAFAPEREETISGIFYNYLDCGMDGIPELLVKVVTTGDTYGFVIKNISGKLQVCYAYEEWARSSTTINEGGLIYSGGSGGATNHGFDQAIIDKDGKYHFVYALEYSSDDSLRQYSDCIDIDAIDPVLLGNTEIDELRFEEYEYWLEDDESSVYEAWNNQKKYYTYYDLTSEEAVTGDEPMYQEGSEYAKAFWNDKMEFLRPDEFQALIDQKKAEKGITEAIETSREVELLELVDYEDNI